MESYRVHPDFDLFYINSFLSLPEQDSTYQKIISNEKKWIQLRNRRLQAYPSELLKGTTLIKAPLPGFLTDIIQEKFEALQVFSSSPHARPNHVLVNEYLPGQGITPHEDGNVYCPIVATITLGSHCVYNLYGKEGSRPLIARVLQEPGSCMITRGPTYRQYLHGIDEITTDENLSEDTILNWRMLLEEHRKSYSERTTRLSLTYRDVLQERAFLQLNRK